MKRVIRIVDALHGKGMLWTEIKAENFVVVHDGNIKGIDLESVIYYENFLQMYTAEAVPPEFPVDDLCVRVPEMQPDYSFDMWGLGILLFEMATGEAFYQEGLTDIEHIKGILRKPQHIQSLVDMKLSTVDPEASDIIKQCLSVDPAVRGSCSDLLQNPFFAEYDCYQYPTRQAVPVPHSSSVLSSDISELLQNNLDLILDLDLLDRINAVLDAIKVCAEQKPLVVQAFLQVRPWTESSYKDLALIRRYRAVLEAIEIMAKEDPEIARDFLSILHNTPKSQLAP